MERLVVQGRLVQGWAYCTYTSVYQCTAFKSPHKQSPGVFIHRRVNVEPQEREVNLVLMGYQDKKEAQEPLDLTVPRLEPDFYSTSTAALLYACI